MDVKEVIRSQYHATLSMLETAVAQCPDALWNDEADKNRFWHVAYHALFYAHLYLQPTHEDFVPWPRHNQEYSSLGSADAAHETDRPYHKEEILEYIAFCRQQVDEQTAAVDLHAESGFDWLPMRKLEVQFYNIRHIQQHAGELCERLGSRAGIDVRWVGLQRD